MEQDNQYYDLPADKLFVSEEGIRDFIKRTFHGVVDNINEIMKNPGKVPYIDKYQKEKYIPASKTPMPKPDYVETKRMLGF